MQVVEGRREALLVSASFLRAAFGGAAAVYSLRLGQPCSSVVVVHLLLPSDALGCVRLSSDRLCFTPANCQQPQLVRVEALENHQQWSVITHRLFSLDRNFDRAETPTVVVQTEATPLECPLLTFGGLATKRQAAARGSSQSARLDILAALPEDVGDMAETQTQDVSWCLSHLASGCHFSVAAVVQPRGTTLLSWGLNANGELGNSTMTSSPSPQQVVTFAMQLQREPLSVAHVSCGKHHVAVITGQARLFTWGSNKYGQLGLGDFASRTQPEEVHFALATLSSHRRALRVMHTVQRGGNNVTHVACGAAHTLFVTHQQQLLGMGYNQAGQLGLGHRLQQHKGWRSCTPIALDSLRDQSILDLAAGQNHSACALSNGDVYTWGCGDDGRLGDARIGEGVASPTLVAMLHEASVRARSVRCGARHMAVISDSDLLYVWGANDFGQLGCKDKKPRSRPRLLATPSLVEEGVEDVALGEFHTTCVTSAGKAYAWGLNLRDNSALVGSHNAPELLALPDKERVRKISCGWTHTNIVTYVTADEASVSGQGTTFDRKIERERLLQRKAEVARWRAFVSSCASHKAQGEKRLDSESSAPPAKTAELKEATHQPAERTHQSEAALLSEQELAAKMKRFVAAFADQAMKEAAGKVYRLLHARSRNTSSAKAMQSINRSALQSPQLKGIFYRNQLRPPALPAPTGFAPSRRTLWTSPVSQDGAVVSFSTPKSSSLTPRSTCFGHVATVSERAPHASTTAASASVAAAAHIHANTPNVRAPPAQKRTATPSPRRHVAVVEALMHQASYSITQGATASARSRPQSK